MQAWTPSCSTWSRKYRPTTRLPIRRPRPSAKTVSTVSTSPFLISDSRALPSARSSGTGMSPGGDERCEKAEAAQSAAILPVGGHVWQYATAERHRPGGGSADGDGGDQEDQEDEAEDAEDVAAARDRGAVGE